MTNVLLLALIPLMAGIFEQTRGIMGIETGASSSVLSSAVDVYHRVPLPGIQPSVTERNSSSLRGPEPTVCNSTLQRHGFRENCEK